MAKIKVKCNGPEHHVNEIDLDKVLRRYTVLKGSQDDYDALNQADIPERVVLNCRECTFKVNITRAMIKENLVLQS
jgi:hypothetical protein